MAWLYGVCLLMAVESLIANERPTWFVGLCRWSLGIRYHVRMPVRAGTDAVGYRSSASEDVPWRSLGPLVIEGARIDRVGGDTFLVVPTGWRGTHLTRIDLVRHDHEVHFRARSTLSPLSMLLLVVWTACVLSGVGELRGSLVGTVATVIVGMPVWLFRARSDAMEHARLAMERIGDAIRDSASAHDHVRPPWTARARVALALLLIPLSYGVVHVFERPPETAGGAALGIFPTSDPLAVQRHVDVSARRGVMLRDRGLAYEPTVHTGLARLDDETLLAHHAIEVRIARGSQVHCATLADGSVLDLYFISEVAELGEEVLVEWETQLDLAVAHELAQTGAPLPDDPDAIVEAAWRGALNGLAERDAERRERRLHVDPDGSLELRCRSYLEQEDVLSHLPSEDRAQVLRARHLIAARERMDVTP